MTDRQIVYPYEGVQDVDILLTNKNAMIGLGYALQAILGTGTYVDGLACTPTTPASMSVLVATGSIYGLQQIDASAYGSLAADTAHSIVKQGIVPGSTTFACPAPVTPGQSVVYLVQAEYQDVDSGSTNEPFVNSTTGVPYSSTVNTVRRGVCVLALKTGTAATTGTQAIPAPDAGYTGLWAITVANGATSITGGNIAQIAGAPFINPKLPNIPSYIAGILGNPSYVLNRFTSGGTFVAPSVTSTSTVYKYTIVGGGGGGGGTSASGAGAGGGGGGGIAQGTFTGIAPSTSIAITVGAGGAAGLNTGGDGGAGGGSSIGSPVAVSVAGGGGGGGSTVANAGKTGGSGGSVTSGGPAISIGGQRGGNGLGGSTAALGGAGASCAYGFGGIGAALNTVGPGGVSTGYGSGGGGAVDAGNGGSAGSGGLVIIEQVTL